MEAPSPSSSPAAHGNRLSIAHLLLWTGMWGLVLAVVRGTFRDVSEVEQLAVPLALHLWLQRLLAFAMSPAYGAALAGLYLAGWRLATRRPGFPSQPGHWLLLTIGVVTLWIGVEYWFTWKLTLWIIWRAVVGLASLAVLATIAAISARATRWQLSFGLAAGGSAASLAATLLQVMIGGDLVRPAAIPGALGALAIASGVMAGLASGILDLTAPENHDLFHWAGVAALAAVAAHPLVAWFVMLATIG